MSSPPTTPEAAALEAIIHLQKKVCLMWGSPELDVFIGRLIMDSRDGRRQGLPMPVCDDLMFLAETNKIVRAIDMAREQRVPLREALRAVETGDQKRWEIDTFDNPLVSHDTIVHTRGSAAASAAHAHRREAPGGGPWPVLVKLVLLLAALGLAARLLWPELNRLLAP